MITFENAKSGAPVLKKDGRWLASSVDPLREAAGWASTALERSGSRDSIFVLGLGAGYHVAELLRVRPRGTVTVIECDSEIRTAAEKISPSIIGARIIVEPNWMKLPELAAFRDAVASVYRIALHGPSVQSESEYYNSVERMLLGRDKLSFLLLLKARPEFLGLLSADAIAKLEDEAISVKTMARLFAPQADGHRERRLWRALEELVL